MAQRIVETENITILKIFVDGMNYVIRAAIYTENGGERRTKMFIMHCILFQRQRLLCFVCDVNVSEGSY